MKLKQIGLHGIIFCLAISLATNASARRKNPFVPTTIVVKYDKNSTSVTLTYLTCEHDPKEKIHRAIMSSLAQSSLRAGFPYFVITSESGAKMLMNGIEVDRWCLVSMKMLTEQQAVVTERSDNGPFRADEMIDEYGIWTDIYWRDKHKPKNATASD